MWFYVAFLGLNRIARKLGIDCAPAMMGWEIRKFGFVPVFDGFVVCEEFKDTLMVSQFQYRTATFVSRFQHCK